MADTTKQEVLLTVNVIDNFVKAKQKAEAYKKELAAMDANINSLMQQQRALTQVEHKLAAEKSALIFIENELADATQKRTAYLEENAAVMARADANFKKAQKTLESAVTAEEILNSLNSETAKSLGEIQQQLVALSNVSFDGLNPEQIEAVKQAIADTSFEVQQLQQDLKNREPGQFFVNATESAQVLGAGMQVLTGVFGENNETMKALNDATAKLISVTQAMGVVADFVTKKKYLLIAASIKQAVATAKLTIATRLQAAQERGAAVATVGWTVAQKALNLAMKAFPIFAVIAGVAAFIGGVKSVISWLFGKSDALKAAEKALENYTAVSEVSAKKVEQANDKEKSAVDRMNLAHRQKILQMKKNGKTAEEIAEQEARHQARLATEASKASKARSEAARSELTALKSVIETQQALADKGDEDAQEKLKEMIARQRELKNTLEEELNLRKDIAIKQQEAAQARQEQTDADKKNASKKYLNDVLKEIEEQKKLRQEMLKSEEGYLSDDFKTKQEYERRLFDMEESAAQEALDLKKRFGEISQKDYKRQSEILALQRTQFENEQRLAEEDDAKAAIKAQGELHKKLLKELGQEYELQRIEVKEGSEALVTEMEAQMSNLPEDSEQYKKLALDIIAVKEKLVTDLQAIDDKERDTQNLKSLEEFVKLEDDKAKEALEKFIGTKQEKLAIEKQRLEAIRDEKIRLGMDASEEIIAIKANELAAIQASTASELANEELTLRKRYKIKRKGLEMELALLKEGTEEHKAKQREIAALDKAYQEERTERIIQFAEKSKELMSSIFELGNAQDEAKLQKATEQNDYEKQQLQTQLDANLISKEEYNKKVKESDDKLAKEQAKIKRKQAIQDKVSALFSSAISTAQSIVASSKMGFPAAIPFVAMAAALGAVQMAAIAAQPIPKAAKGMLIKGNSHAGGGVQIEAEGGEMVINKKSSSMFAPLLSAINEAGGGVPFVSTSSDGGFAMRDYQRNSSQSITSEDIASAVKEAVQEVKIYTAIEDINEGSKKYAAVTDSSKY